MTSSVAAGIPSAGLGERSTQTQERDLPCGQQLPLVFGPVQTRRLGWSLGINNVRPKTCSYACVYCQLGATNRARTKRETHCEPAEIANAVRERVATCRESGQVVDYATFVPDGEPTLDIHLGESIRRIRRPDLRVAVITNASLLWREDVREELAAADWVSLKVDTVDERTWWQLNRPIRRLDHAVVLAGMRRFAEEFHGYLATETMLVAGLNDDEADVRCVADFVRSLHPSRAYITVPDRPASEPWARAPLTDATGRAAEAFAGTGVPTTSLRSDQTEMGFASSPDVSEGLTGILAVHPMTERAAREYVARSADGWRQIEELIEERRIVRTERDGTVYLRVDHVHGGQKRRAKPIGDDSAGRTSDASTRSIRDQ